MGLLDLVLPGTRKYRQRSRGIAKVIILAFRIWISIIKDGVVIKDPDKIFVGQNIQIPKA